MPLPIYPHELENKTWQKKKSALAGETGIGDKLTELAAAYKRINAEAFTTLENARSVAELEQHIAATEHEATKVQAAAKTIRDFSLFAPRKAAELSKKKTFPKDTLKLIEQLGHAAEALDVELVRAADGISKAAAERLAAHPSRGTGGEQETDKTLAGVLNKLRAVVADNPFHFVLAVGKPSGLVIVRTAITAANRNDAKAMRQGPGKLIEGTCHCEGGIYIFVLADKPPAGLAANIAKAVLAHAGRKVRVKVRGPGVELDDELDAQDVPDEVEQSPEEDLVLFARRLSEEMKQLVNVPENLTAALKNKLADALRLFKANNIREGEAVLKQLETALERLRQGHHLGQQQLPTTPEGRRNQALERKKNEQTQIHDVMSKNVEVVRGVTFRKGRSAQLGSDKALDVGQHFKDVLTTLTACENDRSDGNVQALTEQCRRYLRHVGRMSKSEQKREATQKKVQLAQGFLREARLTKLGKDYSQLAPPPWSLEQENRAAELQTAFFFEEGGANRKDGRFGASPLDGDESGVSGAWWIKRVEGGAKGDETSRLYIFKPGDAELDNAIIGFPKGTGVPREVLAKTLSDQLALAGLEVGVCPTTIAEISSEMLPDRQGNVQDVPTRLGAMQRLAPSNGSLDRLNQEPDLGNRVDKKSYDQVAVFDLLMGSLDRHGKNMLVQEDAETGTVNLVPIDHGYSLPDRNTARLHRERIIGHQNVMLRDGLSGQRDSQLGEEVRERLRQLNPEEVVRGMREANEALARQHPQTQGAISEESLLVVKRNLEFIQKAAGKMSVGELFSSLGMHFDQIHNARPEDLDRVVEEIRAAHERRKKALPGALDYLDSYGKENTAKVNALKDLGWLLNESSGDVPNTWLRQNAHEVTRILKARLVNPQAQALIDSLVQELGGLDQLGFSLEGKTIKQQIDELQRAITRRAGRIDNRDPDAIQAEIDRLGGKALVARIYALVGSASNEPEDQLTTLRLWPSFQAQGGMDEYLRLGGPAGGTIVQKLQWLRELKAQELAFASVRELSDTEIATRQQADLKRVVKECRDKFEALKSQKSRKEMQPLLHQATESFQQHQIDKAHGQFLFLAGRLDQALNGETTRLRLFEEDLASLEQKLAQAPDRPAVATLRQRRQQLAGRVPQLVQEVKLDDVDPLLARLTVDVSLELEGDNALYIKLGRGLAAVEQRLAQYTGTPIHTALAERLAEGRRQYEACNLRMETDFITLPDKFMDIQDQLPILVQRAEALHDHPRYPNIEAMVTKLRSQLAEAHSGCQITALDLKRLVDSLSN